MEQPTSTRPVRILIQRTEGRNGWAYRLIAYEDKRAYIPVEFDAVRELVNVIRRVIPEFSESSLTPTLETSRAHIAFRADCALDDSQLSLLGLNLPGKTH